MSYLNNPYTAPSLNGIITLTDGIVNIENGNINNVNTLSLENLEITDLVVDNSITAVSGHIQHIDGETLIYETGNLDLLNASNIQANEGYIGNLKADTIEAITFQIDNLELEILKLKKNLSNNFISYTSANNHLMAQRLRCNKGNINILTNNSCNINNANINNANITDLNINSSFNFMPTGTLVFSYSQTYFLEPHWILPAGQWVRYIDYPRLYTVIGDTFGTRFFNGYTEFKMPNFQGCFLRGTVNNNKIFDGGNYEGANVADYVQTDSIKAHTHETTFLYNESFNNNILGGGVTSVISNIQNYTSGSLNQTQESTETGGTENLPLHQVCYLYMKT